MKPMTRRFLRTLCAAAAVAVVFTVVPTVAEAEEKSLYERLGGTYAISTAVDDLVDRLYVNGTLNANPAIKAVHDLGQKAGFKFRVTAWVIEKAGGPMVYAGLPLDEAHAHLNITDREFNVVGTEVRTTLYKLNVPERELGDLMALLESYRSQVVTAGMSGK